jgi:hypothetical protein
VVALVAAIVGDRHQAEDIAQEAFSRAGRGTAQVRNMFTGQTIATIAPPHGQFFAGVAAAGDDRTFVLQAEVGGQTPNSPMPVNAPPLPSTSCASPPVARCST